MIPLHLYQLLLFVLFVTYERSLSFLFSFSLSSRFLCFDLFSILRSTPLLPLLPLIFTSCSRFSLSLLPFLRFIFCSSFNHVSSFSSSSLIHFILLLFLSYSPYSSIHLSSPGWSSFVFFPFHVQFQLI